MKKIAAVMVVGLFLSLNCLAPAGMMAAPSKPGPTPGQYRPKLPNIVAEWYGTEKFYPLWGQSVDVKVTLAIDSQSGENFWGVMVITFLSGQDHPFLPESMPYIVSGFIDVSGKITFTGAGDRDVTVQDKMLKGLFKKEATATLAPNGG